MKKARFETLIHASKERVWDVLWKDEHYRNWTSVFMVGSYAESDWKEGSEIKFLSPGGSGLYSEIAKKVPNEFLSFRHLAAIVKGEVQPENEEFKNWAGATENYSLKSEGNDTLLIIEMDVADDSEEYFLEAFPKALSRIKEIAESDSK